MTIDEMKKIKKEKGYSYSAISKGSGVPLGTVQKIFGGDTLSPRYSTLQALEQFFQQPAPCKNSSHMVCEDSIYQGEPLSGMVKEPATSYDAGTAPFWGKRQGEYTVADYYALPDDRRVELIDGVIYDMSSPSFVHQHIAGRIFYQFTSYIDQKKGNCISMLSPIDVRLDCDDKTMVQPDFIIICDKNHDKIRRWGIMGAPDFILEILSPSTRKKDIGLKLMKYMEAGVREYWIIDPDKQKLLVYDIEHDELPVVYGLHGKVPVRIYDGDLEIDLDLIGETIQDYPEE